MSSECLHEVTFAGLCGLCGKEIQKFDYDQSPSDAVHILHGNLDLQVSRREAERVEQEVMGRLLQAKKLSLVIDLDQTILHATMDQSIEEWISDPLHKNYAYTDDMHRLTLPANNAMQTYYVKFRPGLGQFLKSASELFELHIYTMGSRPYALACAKLMDPTGSLFSDRILSRDDAGLSLGSRKSLKRIFPHSSEMVLVLDDRGDVWEWCGNLVPIRPFFFFAATGDLNSPTGATAGIVKGRVEDVVADSGLDDELTRAWNRLQFIHSQYFNDGDDHDVAQINSFLRKSVFHGAKVCLSGVANLDVARMAEAFGAVVIDRVSVGCTVLVCATPFSEEHQVAAELQVPVVHPDWLWQSCWTWCMLDHEGFLLPSSQNNDQESVEEEEEEIIEMPVKKHRHEETDLLEWLDEELESSSMSGDSDDIYGHSPGQALSAED